MQDNPRPGISKKAQMWFLLALFMFALPSILALYPSHAGRFLVASSGLHGTPFEQAVIYIAHHDLGGAYGVIINRPVPEPMVARPPELAAWKAQFFSGGPVEQGRMLKILAKGVDGPNGLALIPLEELRMENPVLAASLDKAENAEPVWVYMGYAGWGPFQLDREVVQGSWGLVDYDAKLMFETPPDDIWPRAAERAFRNQPPGVAGGL